MRSGLAVFLILFCAASGFAQSQGTKSTQDTTFMSWVHDAWKTVQEQGRPAAEKLVRQWPKRFQGLKQQVADLSKRAHDKVLEMDLEQKKNLITELWRMRKSLDLLTLLQPEVLHSLTGMDTTALANLEVQVKNITAIVQSQIDPKKHVKL